MTDIVWQATDDAVAMLSYLQRPMDDRKLRLLGVACCRANRTLLIHHTSRDGIDWAEQYADGNVVQDEESALIEWRSEGAFFRTAERLQTDELAVRADEMTASYFHHTRFSPTVDPSHVRLTRLRTLAAGFANHIMMCTVPYDPSYREFGELLSPSIVRDIFGNPFRPVTFNSAWQTSTAIALAQTMYDSRDFAAMPILADALEDAGCTVPEVLNHCRDPKGVHVRGCWVVDLVLGKK